MLSKTTIDRRRKAGLCCRCGASATIGPKGGLGFCDSCRAKAKQHQATIRAGKKVLIAAGLCSRCRIRQAEAGASQCKKCIEYQTNRKNQLRKERRCVCGSRLVHTKLCATCLSKARQRTAERKLRIVAAYGGRCICCGEDNPTFLCIDHVNNDGKKHREVLHSGTVFYQWLESNNYPKEALQLLCYNCNMGKQLNGGICPHQLEVGGIRACH